jgi:hypothetical protein
MIISCTCDPHYVMQILNLMNTNNQTNDQKYQSFTWQPHKMKFVASKIFMWFIIWPKTSNEHGQNKCKH